jgi:hypothetical protein
MAKKIPRLRQPGIFSLVFIKRHHLQTAANQISSANIHNFNLIAAGITFIPFPNFLNWHIFAISFFQKSK